MTSVEKDLYAIASELGNKIANSTEENKEKYQQLAVEFYGILAHDSNWKNVSDNIFRGSVVTYLKDEYFLNINTQKIIVCYITYDQDFHVKDYHFGVSDLNYYVSHGMYRDYDTLPKTPFMKQILKKDFCAVALELRHKIFDCPLESKEYYQQLAREFYELLYYDPNWEIIGDKYLEKEKKHLIFFLNRDTNKVIESIWTFAGFFNDYLYNFDVINYNDLILSGLVTNNKKR